LMNNYVENLSPLAQTIFAKLYLRKRIWFNTHLHLSNYKDLAEGKESPDDAEDPFAHQSQNHSSAAISQSIDALS
jgi:hypothetical protein